MFHLNNFSVVTTMIVITSCTFLLWILNLITRTKKNKLPPMNSEWMLTTLRLMSSAAAPDFTLECTKKLGFVFRFNMPLPMPFLVCCDAKLARVILEEHPDKPHMILKSLDGISDGAPNILTKKTFGHGWDWARKGVATSFSFTNLVGILPKIYPLLDEVESMVDAHAEADTAFDIDLLGTRLTMDFIGVSMFGADFRTIHEGSEGRRIQELIAILLKEYSLRQPLNPLRQYFFWDADVAFAARARKEMVQIQTAILDDYRRRHSPEELESDQSILASLIRSPYPTEKERIADMTFFLVAGHETTGSTLAWTVIEVARRPDVYLRIRTEIDAIIAADVERVTPHMAGELRYLDMVIKESMRLWPAVAMGSIRELSSDIHYQDMLLPKGSACLVPFLPLFRVGIQDPELFDPDRWAETAPEIDKLKELFLPFASGKRNCVGQNLAMLELKLALATLFRSFSFRLEKQDIEKDYFTTLKPANVKIFAERV